MTTGLVKTQGTELYFVDASVTASAPDLVKMSCPTGVQGLGGAKDQIETTCLDATTDKEFAGGLGNPGTVSVPFNLIPRGSEVDRLPERRHGAADARQRRRHRHADAALELPLHCLYLRREYRHRDE